MITDTEIVELHRPLEGSKYYPALPPIPILSANFIENNILFLNKLLMHI